MAERQEIEDAIAKDERNAKDKDQDNEDDAEFKEQTDLKILRIDGESKAKEERDEDSGFRIKIGD